METTYEFPIEDIQDFYMNVTYKHFRYVNGTLRLYSRKHHQGQPASKGGLTVAAVQFYTNDVVIGVAECSQNDNFSYAIGRYLATEDAMNQYKTMMRGGVK